MKTENKKMKRRILSLALGLLCSIPAMAQDVPRANIGDAAPGVKYAKWIKGTPVKEFKNDHLYVMEFWATWCGPCKAAMPELSALAKKYKDKATFMGVNVWEHVGEKPYESSLPMVTKFVNSIGEKMSYNVLADNNDQYMVNNWLLPYGQKGIPATFLVSEGKVVWVGHPVYLDSIMNLVITKKYDVAGFKKEFAAQMDQDAAAEKANLVFKPINAAYKAKDYETTLKLLEGLDPKNQRHQMSANYMRFIILLEQNKEAEAIAFGKNWVKTAPMMISTVGGAIMDKEGLSKDAYLYAIELYMPMFGKEGVVEPALSHQIAAAYAKAGDLKNAVVFEEKAVETAKQAVKEGKYLGTIMDYTVTEYQTQLTKYKSQK
jgi:thiol-disulfide isomerase/thioredoxin